MEPATGTAGDEPSTADSSKTAAIVNIDKTGDVILDVNFETSKDTLTAARKVARAAKTPVPDTTKAKTRVCYRVQTSVLRRHSKYFENLLGNSSFSEGKLVAEKLAEMSLANIKPSEADPSSLAWIRIEDDDQATRYAGRDAPFGDFLRILHGQDVVTRPLDMRFVTALVVIGDRFSCTSVLSRSLATKLKFKWPSTDKKPHMGQRESFSGATEDLIRQKILVSWLLDQPPKLVVSTKNLIIHGSRQWSPYADWEAEEEENDKAIWWCLQDGLEAELRCRRECIMNAIASIQRHFLKLYTSRERQCKLGYGNSAACDSYQLGELIKFLAHKNLLFLSDFGPSSLESLPDTSMLNIDEVLTTLRQLPSYQIDSSHTNCGPRNRIIPILDYVQAMLASSVVSINGTAWKRDKYGVSWATPEKGVFRFTRQVAGDQRLRYESSMGAEKLARDLFTSSDWDWTPEDAAQSLDSFPQQFRFLEFGIERDNRRQ